MEIIDVTGLTQRFQTTVPKLVREILKAIKAILKWYT